MRYLSAMLKCQIYLARRSCSKSRVMSQKKLGSHVFTTEYESVIAYGRIRQILNYEEQNRAMALLCQKYMPDKAAFVQHSVDTERKHFECLWHRAYSYQRKGEDSLKSLAS